MKMHLEWARPVLLKDGARQNMIYTTDLKRLPRVSGIYILGRRWGTDFEALYVGQATNIQGRVTAQLNNLRLMQYLKNARAGKRIVLVGKFVVKGGQNLAKCLDLSERALIRYFLSEGHALVNKQGAQLRQHELASSGKHPKKFIPALMFLEKTR